MYSQSVLAPQVPVVLHLKEQLTRFLGMARRWMAELSQTLSRLELKFVREEQKKRETQAALPVEAEPMVTEIRCICLCPEHHNLHQLLEDSLRLRGNICESK